MNRDKKLEEKIKELKQARDIQGDNGNWNYSDYMCGLYNGLELGLAIMEGRDPKYRKYDGSKQDKI